MKENSNFLNKIPAEALKHPYFGDNPTHNHLPSGFKDAGGGFISQ